MIRDMGFDDIPEVICRIHDAGNESGWIPELEFDAEHIAERVASMIAAPTYLAICSDDVGAIMFATASGNWFSPTIQARELLIYAHPSVRNNGYAKAMIAHYQHWAKQMGAVRINAGISLNIKPEKVVSLYESLGFNQSGYLLTQIVEK